MDPSDDWMKGSPPIKHPSLDTLIERLVGGLAGSPRKFGDDGVSVNWLASAITHFVFTGNKGPQYQVKAYKADDSWYVIDAANSLAKHYTGEIMDVEAAAVKIKVDLGAGRCMVDHTDISGVLKVRAFVPGSSLFRYGGRPSQLLDPLSTPFSKKDKIIDMPEIKLNFDEKLGHKPY